MEWFNELTQHFRRVVWLNPTPAEQWRGNVSTVRLQRMLEGTMLPLTNEGLTVAMRALAR